VRSVVGVIRFYGVPSMVMHYRRAHSQQPPFRPTNTEEARYELVKPKEEDSLVNYPEPYQDPIMVRVFSV
jgi:hypothetical protein